MTKKFIKKLSVLFLGFFMICAFALSLNAYFPSGTTLTASAAVVSSNDGNYLELENEGKNNGAWNILVKNNTGRTVDILYNEKMCFSATAKDWSSLDNITCYSINERNNKATSVANGSSVTISVKTNGTAGYVTFSYVLDSNTYEDNNATRYITWAHNLTSGGNISVGYARVNAEHYFSTEASVDLALIAKNKTNTNKWIVKLKNISSGTINFVYNEKMCFKNDAETFSSNLIDKKTVVLNAGESAYLYIYENNTAGYITMAHVENSVTYRIAYGHNLNASTLKMSVSFTYRTV